MSGKIDFYTNPMSRGQIARWALHEAGADYEQHLLDYASTMKGNAYLAVNPMGKVPAIVHRGKVITECAAICAYLADTHADADLAPRDEERADYYRWLFFAAGPLEQAVTNRAMGFAPSEEQGRMAGYGSYDLAVSVLDSMLSERDYVCGDRFTMADVYVGAAVSWGVTFGTLPSSDALSRYSARVTDRDPYRAAKAIDDALIAVQQAAAPA